MILKYGGRNSGVPTGRYLFPGQSGIVLDATHIEVAVVDHQVIDRDLFVAMEVDRDMPIATEVDRPSIYADVVDRVTRVDKE